MSQEHVEVVQRFFDDYNETGHPCWADIDPEVVWVVDLDAFIGGTYHGHEGGRTILGRMAEVFGEVRAEIDELLDVGDSVVALVRIRVQGLQSGAPGMQQGAVVFKLCDGLIVGYRSYLRKEEALWNKQVDRRPPVLQCPAGPSAAEVVRS